MLKKFEIKGVNSKTIDPKKYASIFKEFGVVVFRDFFSNDPDFDDYYNDIKKLALIIAKKCNIKIDSSLRLNEILTILSKSNRDEVGNLYDLGTRPIKLLSGLKLKTNPAVISFIKTIMGEDAVLGFPYSNEVTKPEFEATLTDDAKVYVENVNFLVPLSPKMIPELITATKKAALANQL